MNDSTYIADTFINTANRSLPSATSHQVCKLIGEGEIQNFQFNIPSGSASYPSMVCVDIDGIITVFKNTISSSTLLVFSNLFPANIIHANTICTTYLNYNGYWAFLDLTNNYTIALQYGKEISLNKSSALVGTFKFKKYCRITLSNTYTGSRTFSWSVIAQYKPNNNQLIE